MIRYGYPAYRDLHYGDLLDLGTCSWGFNYAPARRYRRCIPHRHLGGSQSCDLVLTSGKIAWRGRSRLPTMYQITRSITADSIMRWVYRKSYPFCVFFLFALVIVWNIPLCCLRKTLHHTFRGPIRLRPVCHGIALLFPVICLNDRKSSTWNRL